MKWPIKVPPGEEPVFLSILFSIGLVLMGMLAAWIWPEVIGTLASGPS